jgi:hypothetical protein
MASNRTILSAEQLPYRSKAGSYRECLLVRFLQFWGHVAIAHQKRFGLASCYAYNGGTHLHCKTAR